MPDRGGVAAGVPRVAWMALCGVGLSIRVPWWVAVPWLATDGDGFALLWSDFVAAAR